MLIGLDKLDIICFDNIEHIAGNPTWEMAFFYFFNLHRDQGHTLILSASCPPNEIAFQLPDLKTRLNWGLTLKIQPLSDERKNHCLNFQSRPNGLRNIASSRTFSPHALCRDLSSLWVLLTKLDHASLAAKRKLTLPFLKQILSDETP